ncbi:MAG: hypothetical protein AMS18_06990 [Gemmatimonas sp. SG8_17]|nr:MAG: hypothetical protein AMS18_06990 [Gemmatimonas sp. SG8_17]
MHGSAVLLTGLVLGLTPPGHRGEPEASHPLHVSYGSMVLEGDFVVLKVRMFQDDLETVLGQFHNIGSLRLRADPIVDSLFTGYFNTKFTLAIGDSTVQGAVVASGESDDMWWFTVLFEGWEPITEISFRNDLLFDLFDDQRNITRVLYTPTERHRTYYSVATDPETHRFSAHD